MAFSFFNKVRQQIEFEKQQKELEKKQREEEARKKALADFQKLLEEKAVHERYSNWYSSQVDSFVNLLRTQNFIADWGFEAEAEQNTKYGTGGKPIGSIFLFDFPILEGVAFDEKSKQLLYYKFSSGYYNRFSSIGDNLQFSYYLIPFDNIYCANIEVDSQQICSTVTSQHNVLARSAIGGLVGGDVGAVIGGITSPSSVVTKVSTIPKKIVFNILTVDDRCPTISIEFSKSWSHPGDVASNKSLSNACSGTFSSNKTHAKFTEWKATRKSCSTIADYVYERCFYDVETAEKKEYPDGNLENILIKLKNYAMKIDTIVHRCNAEKQETTKSNNTTDIIAELTKLSELKKQGIITDEEFAKLKAKYI